MIAPESFRGFDLKYDELNQRLNGVKKEFGMRRAISTHSLAGETRTFSEILDSEVETIVLYYLEVQGILAHQLRVLRARQIAALQDIGITLITIEELCERYREIGQEVLDLLNYLDRNSVALRKIILRHDTLFDQKMGSMYFDSRLLVSGNNSSNISQGSQLRQLYRQEGIRAIVVSIRRGLEELYDARRTLLDTSEEGFTLRNFTSKEMFHLHPSGVAPGASGASSSSVVNPLPASMARNSLSGNSAIPKVSFRKRLASHSNLVTLSLLENNSNNMNGSFLGTGSSSNNNNNHYDTALAAARNKSTGSLFTLLQDANQRSNSLIEVKAQRSLSDLEPILKQIAEVGQRVSKIQERTTLEFLSMSSAMMLEFNIRDLNRVEKHGADHFEEKLSAMHTSPSGLYVNLLVTFLYLANQYIVAPTSAQYATKLGMTASMSGLIIGLTPMAALLSSLVYSAWSNYSFKAPLLVSITFAMLGNLLYGMALQYHSIPMILLGRLFTGLGGPRVISRRYIADHVALEDRLVASGQFVSAGAMGLACGPLLASLIDRSHVAFIWHLASQTATTESATGSEQSGNGSLILIQYENVTAPGWIMSLLWLLALIAVFVYFEEPNMNDDSTSASNTPNSDSGNNGKRSGKGGGTNKSADPSPAGSSLNMLSQAAAAAAPLPPRHNIVHVETELWTLEDEGAGQEGEGGQLLQPKQQPAMQQLATSSNEKTALLSSMKKSSKPNISSYTHDNNNSSSNLATEATSSSSPPPVVSMNSSNNNNSKNRLSYEALNATSSTNQFAVQNYREANNPQNIISHDGLSNSHSNGATSSSMMIIPKRASIAVAPPLPALHPPNPFSIDHSNGYNSSYQATDSLLPNHSNQQHNRLHYYYDDQQQPSPPITLLDRLTTSCSILCRYCSPSCSLCHCYGCLDFLSYITSEVHVILFMYIVNKTGQELAVSSMPLLMRNIFHWPDETIGYYMATLGALVLPTNIFMNQSVKDNEEREIMLRLNYVTFFAVMIICYLPALEGIYSVMQYLLGTALFFVTLNGLESVIMSLLSKLISPELAKGTFNSGLLATEAGTFGRVIGDMMISIFGDASTSAGLVNKLYIPMMVLVGIAILLTHRYYARLIE